MAVATRIRQWRQKGRSLIELLITASLSAILLTAFITLMAVVKKNSLQEQDREAIISKSTYLREYFHQQLSDTHAASMTGIVSLSSSLTASGDILTVANEDRRGCADASTDTSVQYRRFFVTEAEKGSWSLRCQEIGSKIQTYTVLEGIRYLRVMADIDHDGDQVADHTAPLSAVNDPGSIVMVTLFLLMNDEFCTGPCAIARQVHTMDTPATSDADTQAIVEHIPDSAGQLTITSHWLHPHATFQP